jgi:hypothetical protein
MGEKIQVNPLIEIIILISKVVDKSKDKVGLLRFELKSIAPEATRIPSYPTGP